MGFKMTDKITREEFYKLADEIELEFLKTATPEQRHQLLLGWNCDRGCDLLDCIVEAKDTDKATILALYWRLNPKHQKQYKDRDDLLKGQEYLIIDDYDLFVKLEKLYISGYYQEQNIAFDPANDIYDNGYNWTTQSSDIVTVLDIPKVMFEKLEGKEVVLEDDWVEGFPPVVDDAINKLRKRIR